MSTLGLVLVALAMAVGVVGTVLPLIPGTGLIWVTGLVYGLVAGFGVAGTAAFALMTALFGAGIVAKVALPYRSGTAGGATRGSLTLGTLLGIVGFFVIPVLGLPLGATLGVLVAQYRQTGDWTAAWRTTKAVILGFGKGALAEATAGIAMVCSWVWWVLAD